MKIAFVYDIPYPWHNGGIEQIFNHEARELAKSGMDVHFFTLRWQGMSGRFSYQGVDYHAVGSADEHKVYRHGRRSIREALFFSLRCFGIFRYSFNAVITDAFPILHLPIIRAYCMLRGCRLIIRVDEVWDKEYWTEYIGILGGLAEAYARFALRYKKAVYVVNSEETAERLCALGISRSRISIFAPIIDSAEIEEAIDENSGRRGAARQILFAGRLIKEKRLDKWLAVIRQVVDRDRRLKAVIVGEGVEKHRISMLIKKLRLSRNVELRPFYKNKKALYKEIIRSKLILHMSEREGLGIVILESLGLGTPVMLPDYSPISRSIKKRCIVAKEEEMPSKILEIIRGGRKGTAQGSADTLNVFSSSGVVGFYRRAMR